MSQWTHNFYKNEKNEFSALKNFNQNISTHVIALEIVELNFLYKYDVIKYPRFGFVWRIMSFRSKKLRNVIQACHYPLTLTSHQIINILIPDQLTKFSLTQYCWELSWAVATDLYKIKVARMMIPIGLEKYFYQMLPYFRWRKMCVYPQFQNTYNKSELIFNIAGKAVFWGGKSKESKVI